MDITWGVIDSEEAEKQGWNIFFNSGSGFYEIERVDELQMFPDDFAVVEYLTKKALRGDLLAIKALEINWRQAYNKAMK